MTKWSGRILVKLTRRIALLEHLLECQITGPGSSSGQEAAVAASGSAAGTLHGQDQERFIVQECCSAHERYRSVAGAGSGALRRPGALQERFRGRISCPGQDL